MSGAQSISARRAYGVQRVCRVWGRARSSVYVRRHATRSRASRRRGPVPGIGAATDEVLHNRRVLEASPFHGEGYRTGGSAKLRVERIAAPRTGTGRDATVDTAFTRSRPSRLGLRKAKAVPRLGVCPVVTRGSACTRPEGT